MRARQFLSATMLATVAALLFAGCESPPEDNPDSVVGGASVETSAYDLVASNGFTYPLNSMGSWPNNNFAACGSYYVSGYCHSGSDIMASYGTTVYAMAAGTVLAKSGNQDPGSNCSSGWGYDYGVSNTCNMALAVQHYDDDGNPFVVIYGHLRYSAGNGAGTTFQPGQSVGVIGRYYNVNGTPISADHLHWGVRPGTSTPTYWGRVSCGTSQPAGQSFPAGCSSDGLVAPGTYLNVSGRNWVAPPVAPTLSSPANLSCPASDTVTLNWANGSGTYRSMIMVCRNSALTTGCINPDGGAVGIEPTGVGQYRSTSYTATLASGTWYWAVRGIAYNDYGGWGNYSSVWSFTTP